MHADGILSFDETNLIFLHKRPIPLQEDLCLKDIFSG